MWLSQSPLLASTPRVVDEDAPAAIRRAAEDVCAVAAHLDQTAVGLGASSCQRLWTRATSPAVKTLVISPRSRGFSAANCWSASRIASTPVTSSPGWGTNAEGARRRERPRPHAVRATAPPARLTAIPRPGGSSEARPRSG
jgi:hypothetical protein